MACPCGRRRRIERHRHAPTTHRQVHFADDGHLHRITYTMWRHLARCSHKAHARHHATTTTVHGGPHEGRHAGAHGCEHERVPARAWAGAICLAACPGARRTGPRLPMGTSSCGSAGAGAGAGAGALLDDCSLSSGARIGWSILFAFFLFPPAAASAAALILLGPSPSSKQPAFSLKKKNPPFKGGQRGRKGSGRRIRAGSDVGRGRDVGRTWAGRARDITRGRSRACCRPSLSLPSGCPSRSKCNSVLPRGEPRQQTPRRFRRLARLRASHRAMSKDEEYDYLFKGGPGRTAPALACEGRHIRSCCRQRRTGWANLDPSRTGLLLHCANAVAALLLCFYRLLTLAGALWRSGAHRGLGRRKVESAFALHPE